MPKQKIRSDNEGIKRDFSLVVIATGLGVIGSSVANYFWFLLGSDAWRHVYGILSVVLLIIIICYINKKLKRFDNN